MPDQGTTRWAAIEPEFGQSLNAERIGIQDSVQGLLQRTLRFNEVAQRMGETGVTDPWSALANAATEIARLRAALLAIREQGYVLGLEADDWPVTDCEEALAR